jgi:hypothetical protein
MAPDLRAADRLSGFGLERLALEVRLQRIDGREESEAASTATPPNPGAVRGIHQTDVQESATRRKPLEPPREQIGRPSLAGVVV